MILFMIGKQGSGTIGKAFGGLGVMERNLVTRGYGYGWMEQTEWN